MSDRDRSLRRAAVLTAAALLLAACTARAADADTSWLHRVLITNDDGIDDARLQVLVDAFRDRAEVWVVAPSGNRSGSSNYASTFARRELRTEDRDLGPGVRAWAVDGFPSDCIHLALTTLMKDAPPDLVLSGVNSSPNMADAWLNSGTIGAVRTATYYGVRGVSLSGLREDPAQMAAVADWVVRFVASPVVRDLGRDRYLTVDFQRTAPDQVKGVRWATRARNEVDIDFEPGETDSLGRRVWHEHWNMLREGFPEGSDRALYDRGYVVVVPMVLDEFDRAAYRKAVGDPVKLPEWETARRP